MLDSHGLIYRILWSAEEWSERFDLAGLKPVLFNTLQ